MRDINKIKLDIFLLVLGLFCMLIGVIVQISAIVSDKHYIGHLGSALVIIGLLLNVFVNKPKL